MAIAWQLRVQNSLQLFWIQFLCAFTYYHISCQLEEQWKIKIAKFIKLSSLCWNVNLVIVSFVSYNFVEVCKTFWAETISLGTALPTPKCSESVGLHRHLIHFFWIFLDRKFYTKFHMLSCEGRWQQFNIFMHLSRSQNMGKTCEQGQGRVEARIETYRALTNSFWTAT